MKRRLGLLFGLGFALQAPAAFADGPSDWDGGYAEKSKRRSDFTLGASGGFSFGQASGYPNEIDKIDNASYRSATDLGLGSGGAFWLGVAFNDYLSFGLGLGGLGLSGNGKQASGGGFLVHIDAFPLFGLSEPLQDLAIFGNFGTGGLQIKGGDEPADGGFVAYLEGGVAYEHFRFWQIACGPTASFIHMWSQSAQVSGVLVGGRFSFYGGP